MPDSPGMIGQRIRNLRRARGMTLEDLAAAVGSYNSGQLSKIENGKARPSLNRLHVIAACLGVPVSAIYSDAPSGFSEPEVALIAPPGPGDNAQAIEFARLAPDVARPMLYSLMRASFGLSPGTVLVIDQDDEGADGDLVLVQVEDRAHGHAETRLLRRLGAHLVGASFAQDPADCAPFAPETHLVKGRIAATAWAPQITDRKQICA